MIQLANKEKLIQTSTLKIEYHRKCFYYFIIDQKKEEEWEGLGRDGETSYDNAVTGLNGLQHVVNDDNIAKFNRNENEKKLSKLYL